MKAVKIKKVLQTGATNTPCAVQGWVRTFRANRFVALNDGSTLDNLQVLKIQVTIVIFWRQKGIDYIL